jgi:hypothetical protein
MASDRLAAVHEYLVQIRRALARGDSTEHTHRSALIDLVHALVKGVHCVNEPKGQKHGHPDIKVTLGETPIGYIETKDVGLNLGEIVESAQLRRYLREIPNLLLTDYLQFIWFENGQERMRANVAALAGRDKLRAVEGQDAALADLLDAFCKAELKTIASPKELAQRMASLARMTRRLIAEALASEPATGDLHAQLKAFREVLLPDIDEAKFADMYAQTICYGLFAAICNAEFPQAFARETAADNLPRTNPFLRQLFHHIVGPDLNDKLKWAVDQIVFLLKHADVGAILKDFGKRTRQEDPVVHFYETFLAEYDPKLRKSRGVYYTPEPVVSYIVRSVDWLLKEKFGKKEGLADPSVLVLDPACGTGTFLYAVIKLIHERISAKGQYGSWSGYVRDNLLPRIFGFELLMAPYAVAHLKLGLLLQETGYDFSGDERLGVFLTNTLEEAAKKSDMLFAQWISEESNAASAIKKDKPVMVVLGNPPYSNFGMMNKGKWILNLLEDYKKDLNEKKLNLDDDYIKFIRWGQWRIDRTGSGILAYISNNSYIDGITHRRMRQSLMETFDSIHILDLHGNVSRKEQVPDGSKDENVFDIQQGVAVAVYARSSGSPRGVTVQHHGLLGVRETKYQWLAEHSVADVSWRQQTAEPPHYFYTPIDLGPAREYLRLPGLKEAFRLVGPGVKAERDRVAINWSKAELEAVVADFAAMAEQELRAKYALEKDSRDWSVAGARSDVRCHQGASCLTRLSYRPFDTRWVWYSGQTRGLTGTPGYSHMRHMLYPNISLVFMRQVALDATYTHFGVAASPVDNRAFYSNKGITTAAPIYLYPEAPLAGQQRRLDDMAASPRPAGKDGRRPNLAPEFIKEFSAKLGLEFVPEQPEAMGQKPSAGSPFGPEDVFNYIYAIFHSPTYRKRYAEFLKIDFPRVPLTSDKKLFWKLVALGRELVALHLLESPALDKLVTKYPKKGSDTVERVVYGSKSPRPLAGEGKGEGAVWINDEQYFEGVKPEWFEFHIGGYQVLQKWLKDRKGRKLSNDDIRHYQRVVVAVKETIRLMPEIDQAIPRWPME